MRAVIASACLHIALPALAAGEPAAGATPTRGYSIPPGGLQAALARFGEESGVMISYASADVADKHSDGVRGLHSREEALTLLLRNTGLQADVQPNGGYIVRHTKDAPIAAPIDSGRLPVIVVTAPPDSSMTTGYIARRSAVATKTDTPIIETPQSISVVTRAQIEAQNAQTMDQALRYTAGIEPESRSAFTGFDFVYGRGFILDRYLDGLKLQGATGFIPPSVDIYNLDRIEVLRGPASVLFGQASPGGIVNMVSKMPSAEPVHEILLQAGSYNNFESAFDLSGPIDADHRLLYRFTGVAHTADSQVDNAKTQRTSIAPSITWRPDADTSITAYASFQRDPHVGLYNFVPAAGTLSSNPNGAIPTRFYAGDPNFDKIDRTQAIFGYQLEHRVNKIWSVRQHFRFMHDDGTLNQVLPLSLSSNGATLNRYAQIDNERLNALALDNQAQAKFSTGALRHTFLAGVDLQRTAFDQRLGQGLAPSLNIFAPVYGQMIPIPAITSSTNQVQDQVGVYAQDQVRFDRWAFLLGGRQDWARSSTDDLLAGKSSSQSDRRFTWRAGAVYLFDNGVAPYVSYSTSFMPQIGNTAGGAAFVPTTAQQYEAGVKYQPPGRRSFVTASAFRLTQQNALTTDPTNPAFQVQTGEIRSQGLELEGHLNVTAGLNLIASYGYSQPIVTRSNNGNVGAMPVNVPRTTASLWADYVQPSGALAGLEIGAGIRYIGYTYANTGNTLRVPGFTLVDAALAYDLSRLGNAYEGWRVALNVSNLFDRTYVSECTNTVNCLYGVRRTFLATVRRDW